MIHFLASARLFFLQGKDSTYAMGIHPAGYLCHLYWGRKVQPDPSLADLCLRDGVAFSPKQTVPGFGKVALDTLRYEYPTANTGDFRAPAIEVRHNDGTQGLRLIYAGHRITAGKPALPGLPATYVESPDEAATLAIDLRDAASGVRVTLSYTVFTGRDVVVRSARVTNEGPAACALLRALSAVIDLPGHRFELLHLPGAWSRERWIERHPLHSGAQSVCSRRGASSHQHNPFFALASPGADEENGMVHGFSFVYSGNHLGGAEVDQLFNTRAFLGIMPEGFSWRLAPGASFQTPEAVLAFSAAGLTGLSHQYHRLYRERLVRGHWRDRERPVLINNWEATYFDFTAEKLLALAAAAKPLGIELFVLDDGWFGARNSSDSSLGDWFPHPTRLPEGLAPLAGSINEKSLLFGLWLEPEMVSPDSRLHREHPDWCLHIPGRDRTEGRNQLVLDFSREEVVEAIYERISAILKSAPISYVKWDMNRHLTEVASAGRAPEHQGETAHRYQLGVYAFMERLTRAFPRVLFEGCAGGGGRYDPGILYYMPQVWCSDNSDAIARLRIQHGTSLVYPPCTMCAHVSDVPNHQIGRTTPLSTRGHVALAGQFGLEIDVTRTSPETNRELASLVELAKQVRPLLRHGDHYRLASPFSGNHAAWMLVSPGRDEALVVFVLELAEPNRVLPRLRLRGLDPGARYRCVHGPEGEWPGDQLMAIGLPVPLDRDFASLAWLLRRVSGPSAWSSPSP